MPLETQVRSRELLLLIRNQDSPPLPITAVRVERRPVYLVFLARHGGRLSSADRQRPMRRAALRSGRAGHESQIRRGRRRSNCRRWRTIRIIARRKCCRAFEATGAALDVSAWKFRKPVKITRAGAQQLELDLDVLAHAQPGFADLRLLRGSNQVPYILERTSISRSLAPAVTADQRRERSQAQPLDHQAVRNPACPSRA